nr:unnamed protein product [Digitaria exilis]
MGGSSATASSRTAEQGGGTEQNCGYSPSGSRRSGRGWEAAKRRHAGPRRLMLDVDGGSRFCEPRLRATAAPAWVVVAAL